MFRTPDPPLTEDFRVTAQYRYGIVKFTVALDEEADPVWLHRVNVTMERSDGATDRFTFAIGAPIRMNPGGRTSDHWRPRAIDLEDAAHARPSISVEIVAARNRGRPASLAPDLDIDDGFERVDDGYRLLPSSAFAQEIEHNKTYRMDGFTTREG